MRDELAAQGLGVRVDVATELREDGEPDVFGPEGEVVVVIVGCDDAVHEAVG